MKKLLIGMMLLGMNISIKAMDDSDAPEQISLHQGALESSFRQTFKDYSGVDVAYAKIPEATIEINKYSDPFEQTLLSELIEKQQQNAQQLLRKTNLLHPPGSFVLARVVTDTSFYYCEAGGLHKKLGIGPIFLPDLSTFKDPRDNVTPLRAINYYTLTDDFCKDCEVEFKHKVLVAFKDFKNSISQQTITAQTDIGTSFNLYEKMMKSVTFECKQCKGMAFDHIAKYAQNQTFRSLTKLFCIGVSPDGEKVLESILTAFNVKTFAEQGTTPLILGSACMAMLHIAEIASYSDAKNHAAASIQCDACLEHLKNCRDYGEQKYPVYSDRMRVILGGLQELVSVCKKIEDAKTEQK